MNLLLTALFVSAMACDLSLKAHHWKEKMHLTVEVNLLVRTQGDSVHFLLNGMRGGSVSNTTVGCNSIRVGFAEVGTGAQLVAVYRQSDHLELLGVFDALESRDEELHTALHQLWYTQDNELLKGKAKPAVFSTYYTTISIEEANAFANISINLGRAAPTVEDAIRSKSQIKIFDLRNKWAGQPTRVPVGPGPSVYHEAPQQFGYYCVYKARAGQAGIAPDCPNIPAILETHAKVLATTGIDFVLFDQTNLCGLDWPTDWLQTRQTEIVYEEWQRLRSQGVQTPYLAHWNRLEQNCQTWRPYLGLYNQYPSLTYKNPANGHFVFFAPQLDAGNPDPGLVSQVKSNGGRNNVDVVTMWAFVPPQEIVSGVWTFFAPCKSDSGNWVADVSNNRRCNQDITRNSALGSQTSLSLSYQMNFGSLPFASSGKLGGLTFQKQVEDALIEKPDHLLIPSFNEHSALAGPTPDYYGGWNAWSAGLENDPDRAKNAYVDTYGAERSRSFEATVESGDTYLRLVQSCVRVIRMARWLGDHALGIRTPPKTANTTATATDKVSANVTSTGNICNVQGEICCDSSSLYFHPIWALDRPDGQDFLLTADQNELNVLRSQGWHERCQPSHASTAIFCVDGGVNFQYEAHRGGFFLFSNSSGPSWGSSAVRIARAPLYRCVGPRGHTASTSANCESGQVGTMESLLGYIATSPSSLAPRALHRCGPPGSSAFYHVLDNKCKDNSDGTILGYVI